MVTGHLQRLARVLWIITAPKKAIPFDQRVGSIQPFLGKWGLGYAAAAQHMII